MLVAWIIVALLVIFLTFCFFAQSRSGARNAIEGFGEKEVGQCYVINLDKDTERYDGYMDSWNASDMADSIPIARFPGIVGRDVSEPEKLLTPKAWDELMAVEKTGTRTHHYQLSRGGIGCFISHLALMKRLIDDDESDCYLIMEDDNHCLPTSKALMTASLQQAPSDWDIICGVVHRAEGTDVDSKFRHVTGFWGLGGYLIRRHGAQKILDEVAVKKMDGQIDAFMSRMAQQGKLKIYAVQDPWFVNTSLDTNIQLNLEPLPGQDPYEFDGYKV
jgi:GR25 family glycosyltransferase involved in LPS biosynthesis